MTVPLFFVRHGQTDWNKEGRLQGQRNIPLNQLGRQQAARNGRVIGPLLEGHKWHVLVSPLGRTLETATILLNEAGHGHLEMIKDIRLIELSFGDWEGRTLREIRDDDPDVGAARRANKWGFVPPGGESYAMLAERVKAWLFDLSEPTLIISHGGVFRTVAHLIGGMPTEEAASVTVKQDRVFLIKGRQIFAI